MASVLAIGSEAVWKRDLVRCADEAGHRVISRRAVFDACTHAIALGSIAGVLVDADCCDDRINPALAALRWRIPARVVIVYGPGSEVTARRLHGDIVVAKDAGADAVLASCLAAGSEHDGTATRTSHDPWNEHVTTPLGTGW